MKRQVDSRPALVLTSILILLLLILPGPLRAQRSPKVQPAQPAASTGSPTTKAGSGDCGTDRPVLGPLCFREDNGAYTKVRLKNDLTVVIKEFHPTDLVSLHLRIRAGSTTAAGFSSQIVDLTAAVVFNFDEAPAEFIPAPSPMRALGAVADFNVEPEATNFQATFPGKNLAAVLSLIARALRAPSITPEAIERARKQLALQEYFRQNQALRNFLPNHSVSSDAETSASLAKTAQEFFSAEYRPQNIVVAIVGDTDREQAIQAIVNTFGPFPKGKNDTKISDLTWPKAFSFTQSARFLPSHHAAVALILPKEDEPTAEFTKTFLSRETGTSLHSLLREKAVLACSISAATQRTKSYSTLMLAAETDEKNLDSSEIMLLAALKQLQGSSLSDEEVDVVKKIWQSRFEEEQMDIQAVGRAIAVYEHLEGDYRHREKLRERIAELTAEDIQSKWRGWFEPTRLAVSERRPAASPAREFTSETFWQFVQLALPRTLQRLGKIQEKIEPPPAETARPPAATSRGVDQTQIKSEGWKKYGILRGPDVYVKELHAASVVAVGVFYPGGELFEDEKQYGATQIMVESAVRATKANAHEELTAALDARGARVIPLVRKTYFGYLLIAPEDTVRSALDFFLDMLTNPAFSPDDVALVQQQILFEEKRWQQFPTERARSRLLETFFQATPLFPSRAKRLNNIEKFTSKDVQAWFDQVQKNTIPVVVILGDTAGTSLLAPFTRKLSGSQFRRVAVQEIREARIPILPFQVFDQEKPPAQAQGLWAAFLGPNRKNDEYDYFHMLSTLLNDEAAPVSFSDFHAVSLTLRLLAFPQKLSLAQMSGHLEKFLSTALTTKHFSQSIQIFATQAQMRQLHYEESLLQFYEQLLTYNDLDSINQYAAAVRNLSPQKFQEFVAKTFRLSNACFATVSSLP